MVIIFFSEERSRNGAQKASDKACCSQDVLLVFMCMYDLAHAYEKTSHMGKMMNNVKHYKLQRIEDKPTLA